MPSVPFVIMTMRPFIKQINPTIESAARMSGASMRKVFTKILMPLLIPGLLAASILVLVRTVGLFDLTFLVSSPQSDTLVVAIYRAMTAAGGGEARQLISSMAVVYTLTMMVILIVALTTDHRPTDAIGTNSPPRPAPTRHPGPAPETHRAADSSRLRCDGARRGQAGWCLLSSFASAERRRTPRSH